MSGCQLCSSPPAPSPAAPSWPAPSAGTPPASRCVSRPLPRSAVPPLPTAGADPPTRPPRACFIKPTKRRTHTSHCPHFLPRHATDAAMSPSALDRAACCPASALCWLSSPEARPRITGIEEEGYTRTHQVHQATLGVPVLWHMTLNSKDAPGRSRPTRTCACTLAWQSAAPTAAPTAASAGRAPRRRSGRSRRLQARRLGGVGMAQGISGAGDHPPSDHPRHLTEHSRPASSALPSPKACRPQAHLPRRQR